MAEGAGVEPALAALEAVVPPCTLTLYYMVRRPGAAPGSPAHQASELLLF